MGSFIFTCLVRRGTNWPFILDDPSRTVCRVTSEWHSLSASEWREDSLTICLIEQKTLPQGPRADFLQSIIKSWIPYFQGSSAVTQIHCMHTVFTRALVSKGNQCQCEAHKTSCPDNNKIHCIWPRIMYLQPTYTKLWQSYFISVKKSQRFYGSYHNPNLFRGMNQSFKVGQMVQSSSYPRWITPRIYRPLSDHS